jgi:hypothetical protein
MRVSAPRAAVCCVCLPARLRLYGVLAAHSGHVLRAWVRRSCLRGYASRSRCVCCVIDGPPPSEHKLAVWCLHWGVVVAWAVSKFWLEGGGLPAAGEWSGCCRVPCAVLLCLLHCLNPDGPSVAPPSYRLAGCASVVAFTATGGILCDVLASE